MEWIKSILFDEAPGWSGDFLILFSIFVAVLLYTLAQGSKDGGKYVPIAAFCLLTFYAGRFVSVFAERLGFVNAGGWFSFAQILNLVSVLATSVLILNVFGEEVDVGVEGGYEREDGRKLLKRGLAGGLAGMAIYGLTAMMIGLSLGRVGFYQSFIGFAGLSLVISSLGTIRGSSDELRRKSLLSFVLFTLAAGIFHLRMLFGAEALAFVPAVSRMVDLAAVVAILSSLHMARYIERVRCMDRAAQLNREYEKAKKELSRLEKLTDQIYEDNGAMVARLRDQVRIMSRKSENLEKIVRIALEIQKQRNIKELLQKIVNLVRENLGFNTVVLRLLVDKSQSFESTAYVGVGEEMEDAVRNYKVSKEDFFKMLEPGMRISNSYFIRNVSPPSIGSNEQAEILADGDAWRDIDMLIVPLQDGTGDMLGYLSVEEPKRVDMPVRDVIESLETIAKLAIAAIQTAQILRELAEKNDKLNVYADKLESLNQMKSNFVATISHEFKTPLTSIRAYAETLVSNIDNMERRLIREFITVIDEESNRLMTLIEDILNFSKMESGVMRFERSKCDLKEIIESVADELDKNFMSKGIELKINLPSRGIAIRADRDSMKQLFLSLLHNASKFTPEDGHVSVNVVDEAMSVRIVVEDDGIGVPEDQVEKIFEHFHQVDASDTRKYGGSGLGLALCRNIVEWHDGKIWVENVRTGGARFTVILPKKQVIVRSQAHKMKGAASRYEIERYLELLVEMVAELLNVRRASIMLVDVSRSELIIEGAIGIDEEIVENTRVKLGESISGKVVHEGQTYLVEDIESDPRIARANRDNLYDSKSFLSVPVKVKGQIVGVVNVSNPIRKKKFDEEDKELMEMFVERMGIALQKLKDFTNMAQDIVEVREALKSILETKRFVEEAGDIDINDVVLMTAEKLKLDRDEKTLLQYALNVYDIGLARIGYQIIKKPSELTDEERSRIREHTNVGIDMLGSLEGMSKVKEIVLYHHENYDGSGYPGKLSAKDIPVGARIIRVADSFRALISERPYQKKFSLDEAIEVLRHRSGTYFDPDVVEAFISSVMEQKDKTRKSSREKGSKKEQESVARD